ncbi:MAG: hypothetical protein R2942_16225 [Ignavibacteria bacterium]
MGIVGEQKELLKDLHDKNFKVYKRKNFSLEEVYKEFSKQEKYVEKYISKEQSKKLKRQKDLKNTLPYRKCTKTQGETINVPAAAV